MTTAASLYPPARARGPFLLVERQNGIMRTGPFERSSKQYPKFQHEAHRHSDSEGWQQTQFDVVQQPDG